MPINTEPSTVLIELHYLPCVHYFSVFNKNNTLLLEACENYQKQSYRNRTRILTAQKTDELSIPVVSGNSHLPIKEIRIDHQQKWRIVHQRSIRSAYGKSPFFEHYADKILGLYDKPIPFLFDFNLTCLTVCLDLLGWKNKIELTTDYQEINTDSAVLVKDQRGFIHPKSEPNIPFKHYQQVFGKQFEPNLSILDLLFCEGNNSTSCLNK